MSIFSSKRHVIAMLMATVVVLLSIASVSSAKAAPKKVRIAAFNFYPTLFQAKDGSVRGFYVDFLKEIAQRENWDIEYVYGNWSDGLARIKSGEVDLLTNVAYTKERDEFLDYGKVPLLTVWSELYVNGGSTLDSIKEVKGKKIALMKGDFNAANFKSLVEKLEIPCTYVELGNFEKVFKAISSGDVDAGVVNNTFGAAKQREYGVQSSGIVFNPFDIYFAATKGKSTEVLATLDKYLAEWRKSEGSPYHQARERWSHKSVSTMKVTPLLIRRVVVTLSLISCVAVLFVILLRIQVRRKTSELKQEINTRKLAEESLQNSEARFRDLFEQAIDAIILFDVDLNKLVDANHAAEKLFGGSREELLQYGALDFYVLKGTDQQQLESSFNDSNERVLAGEQLKTERMVHTLDGREISCEVLLSRLPHETCKLIRGSFLDITLRKQEVTKLMQSEERYRALAESTMSVPWEFDILTDRWTYVAPQAERILGYAPSEWKDLAWWLERLHPDDREWAPAYCRELTTQGLNHSFQYRLLAKDGSVVWVNEIVNVEMKDHQPVLMRGIFIDITDKMKADEQNTLLEEQLRQSQKMEAIGHLAGGVAHDFNNILSVIMGYAQLLKLDAQLNTEGNEAVEQILSSSERAAQLTHGLLAFSRKQNLTLRHNDLNEIVNHVRKLLVRTIGEDVKLITHTNEAVLDVNVDSVQIEQVIINLATNARDAMQKGGVLTIETGLQEINAVHEHAKEVVQPGQYACITVSDTGAGMDKTTADQIFEPFFTTKEVGKGTGLGLSIVYGIVQQHNGFINVYSELGIGTTFRIYLPIFYAVKSDIIAEEFQAPVRGGCETILLAEDDASVSKLVANILQKFGYEVIQAVDGQEAIEQFSANSDKIRLIIMDMIMPKKNGNDAYEEICRIKSGVKVLYCSGYTSDFMKNRGVSEEGIELIMKPVQPMELLRKVRVMLDN